MPRLDAEPTRAPPAARRVGDHRGGPGGALLGGAAGLFAAPRTLRALDGVSLDLRPGETLGVVGESGSGKSTLARAVLRLVRPTSGTVCLLGRELAQLPEAEVRESRRDMQLVFQDPLAALDPRMTVRGDHCGAAGGVRYRA